MRKLFRAPSPETLVRRNALWNLFGLGLPLALAFLFIPRLILGMGADRFGVLTLILAFLNYFGFFDLGIGRALTQLLAGPARDDKPKEATLIWTVSAILVALGAVLALLVFLLSPFLVSTLLRVKGPLAGETVMALRELGLALPFLLHSLALRGVLEARRRFDLSNLVRIPAGVFTFGAPVLVLPFSHNVAVVVAVVLVGRMLAWAMNLVMVFRIMPHVGSMKGWTPGEIWNILRFGGWYTVSNIVAPVIDSLDRFFIGRFLSVSMVAYYTTPYEVVVRLGILSGSVGGAMFPEFASRLQKSQREAAILFERGLKYLLTLLFPFALVATAWAREGLTLWLNPAFAAQSAPVLQWLALFVFLTGAALVPLVFLQGVGRPDLSARMHLIELPAHAGMLYLLIHLDGIRGAAIACVLRILLDFLGNLHSSGKLMALRSGDYLRMLSPIGIASAVLLAFHIPMGLPLKGVLTIVTLLGYLIVAWSLVLEERDKQTVLRILKRGEAV